MTIASEIQRIQTNIANAYDALEAKGATMPATENTDNLVTTIDTISGGGGETVTATNNTGSAISTGDKVWVEYFSPTIERDDNIGSGTVYQDSDNGIIYMTGNGSRVARHGYLTNQAYIYDISGDLAPVQNGTFSATYQNGVLNQFFENNKFYVRNHSTSGYTVFSEDGGQSISGNYYIGAGLYSNRLNVYDENNNIIYTLSGYSNGEITHAYQVDANHIILVFTDDYTYPSWIHKIDIVNGTATVSSGINLYPYSRLYSPRLGFTSDGKYFIVSQRQIINVSTWSVISSPSVFSTVNDNYKPYFNNIGNILTSKCTDGYIRSFKYNTSDETWSEITEIAVQSSGYVGLCNAEGTILIYMASSDSDNASVNVKRSMEGELGWYALSFNNITQNTLTGFAQENIASGSSGDVKTLLPPEPASKKKD